LKIIKKVLPMNHNIFYFGDLHVGSILHYRKGFLKLKEIVCNEYDGIPAKDNYLVDHGDQFEAIAIDDKRFDPLMHAEKKDFYVDHQYEEVKKLYEPIKEKILAILYGNHLQKHKGICNYAKKLAGELEVEYGTWSCKIHYINNNGSLMYKSYHTHGRKQVNSYADDPKRRKVGKQLILKRQLREKFGDCVVMCKGHTHKLIVCPPERELYLTDSGRKTVQNYTSHTEGQNKQYIHPDNRWYVNTGSFMKMYADDQEVSGYAEMAEYDPVELGFVVGKCRNGKIVDVKEIIL